MSDEPTLVFRRLILELAHGPVDANVLRFVAEFARDFGLDLHGVYIEDESLVNLAGFPFAREIQLPTHAWRKLDSGSLAAELHQHAEAARRRLRLLLDQMGLRGGFEIRRGDLMHCVAGVCSPSDIIVVTGSATIHRPNLASMRQAADQSPASVLVIPDRPTRRGGPIVVVTDRLDDPGVAVALRFAAANHVRLLVILPEDGAREAPPLDGIDIRAVPDLNADEVLRVLSTVRERLIVITRGAASAAGMDGASDIAASVSVPVLVL